MVWEAGCNWEQPLEPYLSLHSLLPSDTSTLDGLLILEDSSIVSTESSLLSSLLPPSLHPPEFFLIWQAEPTTLIRPSPRSFRRGTRAGLMLSSVFLSSRDLIISSREPSHSSSSMQLDLSPPSSATISWLINYQFYGELPTCQFSH